MPPDLHSSAACRVHSALSPGSGCCRILRAAADSVSPATGGAVAILAPHQLMWRIACGVSDTTGACTPITCAQKAANAMLHATCSMRHNLAIGDGDENRHGQWAAFGNASFRLGQRNLARGWLAADCHIPVALRIATIESSTTFGQYLQPWVLPGAHALGMLLLSLLCLNLLRKLQHVLAAFSVQT